MNIDELKGEVLTHIDAGGDEIMLTTQSGRKIRIFHSQDCCESVSIEGIDGELHKLVGKVLIDTSEEIDRENNPPEYPDSWTRTIHTFKVDDATVIVRWMGESNGYYSESVDIAEL